MENKWKIKEESGQKWLIGSILEFLQSNIHKQHNTVFMCHN